MNADNTSHHSTLGSAALHGKDVKDGSISSLEAWRGRESKFWVSARCQRRAASGAATAHGSVLHFGRSNCNCRAAPRHDETNLMLRKLR